jgi:hypothetical protein
MHIYPRCFQSFWSWKIQSRGHADRKTRQHDAASQSCSSPLMVLCGRHRFVGVETVAGVNDLRLIQHQQLARCLHMWLVACLDPCHLHAPIMQVLLLSSELPTHVSMLNGDSLITWCNTGNLATAWLIGQATPSFSYAKIASWIGWIPRLRLLHLPCPFRLRKFAQTNNTLRCKVMHKKNAYLRLRRMSWEKMRFNLMSE